MVVMPNCQGSCKGTNRQHGTHGTTAGRAAKPSPSESSSGRAAGTTCPEDLMLLLSTALLIALAAVTSIVIYELHENSQGVSSPSLGSVTGA